MAITSAKTKKFIKRKQEKKDKEYVVYYFLASAARKGPDTVPLKTTRVTAPSKLDAYLKASTPARVAYLVETVAAAERRRKPLLSVDRETYGQYLPIPLPETIEKEQKDPETRLYQQGGVMSIDDYLLLLADAAEFEEKIRGTVALLVQEPNPAASGAEPPVPEPAPATESTATPPPPPAAPEKAPPPAVPEGAVYVTEVTEEKPEEDEDDDEGYEADDDDSYESEEGDEDEGEELEEGDAELIHIDLTEDVEEEPGLSGKQWIIVFMLITMSLLCAYGGYIFGYDAGIAHAAHLAHRK